MQRTLPGNPLPRPRGSGFTRNTTWLLYSAFFLLLGACTPSYYYDEEKTLPNGQWTYANALAFRFSIPDTSATFNLYLDFEYADTFPTQNLYLKLYTTFPDGKRLEKLKSFDFFDAQGAPIGQCRGHKCRLQVMLQENAYFNQVGEYNLVFEQFMRRDSLPGIYTAGLILEENKKPGARQ